MRILHILPLLIMIIVGMYVPSALGYVAPSVAGQGFRATSQPLQVWFDAPPQLTIAYPPAYLFNVAAKTAPELTITSLSWNFGDGSTLNVPFSDQSQVSDIRAHQYATNQNYCVTVTATDSAGNIATASITLMPNSEFTLTATPTQNVTQGGSANYTVNVGSSANSCGIPVRVCLTVSPAPPPGISVTLNPPCGNSPFSSMLLVQTTTSTPQGTYTINILGNSTGATHVATVSLVVGPPYFTVSVSPTSLVVSGQSDSDRTDTATVTVQSFNGFNSPVTLTALVQPPGAMSFSFSNPILSPPPDGLVTSALTITAPCDVPAGSYTIVVQGSSGTLASQAALNVSVSACPSPQLNLFWWILVGGLIGLVIIIPLFFILFGRRRVVPVPPPPVPAIVPVAVPPPPPPPQPVVLVPLGCCDICGSPLVFKEEFHRGYCFNCRKLF